MITLYLNQLNTLDDLLSSYHPNQPIKIYIDAGRYEIKLKISRNNLFLEGIPGKTIITNADYAYKCHSDGLLYNTFRTQTVLVTGSDNTFKNLTIENTAGFGPKIGQSIALSVFGTNNRFINCDIKSNQDTVFIGPLPLDLIKRYDHILSVDEQSPLIGNHYFNNCTISGDVDYIFGTGTAVFDDCDIISINSGFVCAPSTPESTEFGMVFINSRFKSLIDTFNVILARPWRNFGKAHFINNSFLSPIGNPRFDEWDKTGYRFYEIPYILSNYSKEISPTELSSLLAFIESLR